MVKVNKHKKSLWQKRVDELYNKEILDQEQQEALTDMINSPDNENFVMVEIVLKDFIKTKLSEDLNAEQKIAFYDIIDFLEQPKHDALVLKGYAGTGKTFLVKRIIEYIAQTDHKKHIAVTAPTNKAVQVLYTNSPANIESLNAYILEDIFDANSRLVYSTVHKLLGMKEVITEQGEQLFQSDSVNDSELSNYHYLILDEVSMLDDKLCHDVMNFSNKIRIIFMGDPAQIPPIKREHSIPFSKQTMYNFKVVKLTEIMRQQKDNPIIVTSFKVRNNIVEKQPIPVLITDVNSSGHGITCLNSDTDKSQVKPLLEQYFKTDDFRLNADYMKVIAWRNKTVDYVNGTVREILYGVNPSKYMIGEKLIVRKPIFELVTSEYKYKTYTNWKIILNTSEELEVKGVSVGYKPLDDNFGLGDSFIYYKLDISCYNPMKSGTVNKSIYVIHEESINEYNELLDKTKQIALTSRMPIDWKIYYNIMKWSANVTYNYAITAHLSQGSTYKNVLVLEDDLDHNRNIVERNRIKYTSFSRASERLFVLRKNT